MSLPLLNETPEAGHCPHIETCPMFAIFSYAGTLGAWKARYCTAAYEACARYEAAACNQKIPVNLMPNGALLKKAGTGAH